MQHLKILCLLFFSLSAFSVIETHKFTSLEQEQAYQQLTQQLRCPQCQNNNIADSNAIIANDMRAKVYELLQQGKNKQQIIDYMVQRYGNFVTYDPPFTLSTALLWLIPVLLLLLGINLLFRRKSQASPQAQDQQRLNAILHTDCQEKK